MRHYSYNYLFLLLLGLLFLLIPSLISAQTFHQEKELTYKHDPNQYKPENNYGIFTSIEPGIDPYNGSFSYSIPLFQVQNSHLSFPITINYSSKNITVQSEAPPEGTGWQLTAGGSISREINGHTDFGFGDAMNWHHAFGYYGFLSGRSPDINVACYSQDGILPLVDCNNGSTLIGSDIENLARGELVIDTKPDIFTLNVMGESVSFYFFFDENNIPLIQYVGPTNLKIVSYPNEDKGDWIAVDRRGTKYFFNEAGTNAYESTQTRLFKSKTPYSQVHIWHLTRILHPSGEEILFQYAGTTYYMLNPDIDQQYLSKCIHQQGGSIWGGHGIFI